MTEGTEAKGHTAKVVSGRADEVEERAAYRMVNRIVSLTSAEIRSPVGHPGLASR